MSVTVGQRWTGNMWVVVRPSGDADNNTLSRTRKQSIERFQTTYRLFFDGINDWAQIKKRFGVTVVKVRCELTAID